MKYAVPILVLLVGCGTITLERHVDTSVNGLLDPTGACNHFVEEVLVECGDAFPLRECLQECVDEGGDAKGRHTDYQTCLHEGTSTPNGCAGVRYCLEEATLTCASDE